MVTYIYILCIFVCFQWGRNRVPILRRFQLKVSWPNSRATASCIRAIPWSPVTGRSCETRKNIHESRKRGRNATVSNAARVPVTSLTFNEIRVGLFTRNSCHFGINETCCTLVYVTRSVSNRVGLLFEEVTTDCLCWRANRWGWNCLLHQRFLQLNIRS